jgi:hypothetical protein
LVERHWHSQLAYVVYSWRAFDLNDLRRLDAIRLAANSAALKFKERLAVINVRRIKKSA